MKKQTILAFFFPWLGYKKKISYFTTEFHDYDLEMIWGQRIGALGEKNMHASKGLLVLFYNCLIPSLAAITLYFRLQREKQFKMGFWAAKWLATRQVKWFLFPNLHQPSPQPEAPFCRKHNNNRTVHHVLHKLNLTPKGYVDTSGWFSGQYCFLPGCLHTDIHTPIY